jgi:YVTN family beta-propeller protein
MKISRVMWSRLSGGAGLLAVLALAVFAAGCGDVFRPVAVPITGPPGDPQATSFAFVVDQNAPANDGSALQINVPGDSAVFSTPVGVGPVHAALLPPGQSRIFIANRDDDTVTTYIPSFSTALPITLSLASGSHPVFLATTESSKMYVAEAGTNKVGVINGLQSALATEVTVGTTPVALAETRDGKKLYAVNQGDGTVSVIATATDAVLNTITLPSGASPVWAALSPDGLELYVLNQGLGNVSVIDVTSDTVVATLTVGASPNHMFVDTHLNRLYVVNNGSASVSIFNASVDPPTPLATVAVDPGPTSITVLSNGLKAYVATVQPDPANAANIRVSADVINTTSNTVQTRVPFAGVPAVCSSSVPFTQTGGVRFLAFAASSSNSNRAYIASCDAGVIHVLNTATDKFVTDIAAPVSAFPPSTPTTPPPHQRPVFMLAGP